MDLQEERIDRAAVQLVPRELAQKYSLIPLRVQGGELTVATNNPLDFYAFGELGLVTGMQIVPVLATKRDLNDAIHRCYAQQGAGVGAGGVQPANTRTWPTPPGRGLQRHARTGRERAGREAAQFNRGAGLPHARLGHPRRARASRTSACASAWTAS